jgi:hypothetical protein
LPSLWCPISASGFLIGEIVLHGEKAPSAQEQAGKEPGDDPGRECREPANKPDSDRGHANSPRSPIADSLETQAPEQLDPADDDGGHGS